MKKNKYHHRKLYGNQAPTYRRVLAGVCLLVGISFLLLTHGMIFLVKLITKLIHKLKEKTSS